MTEQQIYVPTFYISLIVDQLMDKKTFNKQQWLLKHDIDGKALGNGNNSITYHQYKSLIIDAIKIADEPALGLYVGRRLGITAHGMLGYAIIASSCLREAIDLFARYLNTRTPLLRVELINKGSFLEVQLQECYPLEGIKIPFLESALFTLFNLLMQVTHNNAPISKICLPYSAPCYQHLYQEMFNVEIEFDCPVACIGLIDSKLDKPLAMADQSSLTQAKELCEQELIKLQAEESLQSRIRKFLLSSKIGFPTLLDAAQYFYISPRSLHRKLTVEGTSYSTILKSVKHYRAAELLRSPTMLIQEIAASLDYSDTASFRKAFIKWQGETPTSFRNNQLK